MMYLLAMMAGPSAAQETVSDEEVLPVADGRVEIRSTFDAAEYSALEEMQAILQAEQSGRAGAEERATALEQRLRQQAEATVARDAATQAGEPSSSTARPNTPPAEASREPEPVVKPGPPAAVTTSPSRARPVLVTPRPQVGDLVGQPLPPPAPTALVFATPQGSERTTQRKTVLPAGSYVKTRIMTGVEAAEGELLPMLLEADYAALGPNGRTIDLTGCRILAQVEGDLSTDRVHGKAVTLSCVKASGELQERTIDGYIAGEDSTVGVVGQLISRQGRVLAAATIASLAQGAGDAVAAANSTATVVSTPLGATGEAVTNVDGDTTQYVVGASVAGAAEQISSWYLSYASQLTPSIAVGSGRDVWVVLMSAVEFDALETAP